MRPHLLFAVIALVAVSGCSRGMRGAGAAPAPDVPVSFVRLGTEAQTAQTIAVRNGLSRAAAWKAVTDVLSERHTIAVRDQNAGFAMTSWEASLIRDGVPDLRYRTRLIVTYLGDWSQLQVRSEASWKDGDAWQVGVDRELLARTVAELQGRVGAR